MRAGVALVLVSHSAAVADGLVDIAEQMAPDVLILGAGGTDDGRIGTSYSRVAGVVAQALDTAGVTAVAVLTDLGSATLTAAAVTDDLEDEPVRVVEGPLVEGAVAAAVAAQVGGDLTAVQGAVVDAAARGAEEARTAAAPHLAAAPRPGAPEAVDAGAPGPAAYPTAPALVRVAILTDPLGLHARPAAILARTVRTFDAAVTLEGVPADSVLELMALGLTGGAEVVLAATGPQAAAALDAAVAVLTRSGPA